jgi:photosystem II stability/assembly factor-like uncharacterized protein
LAGCCFADLAEACASGHRPDLFTGVAFTSDLVGYSGGDVNGEGSEILKTVNGGVNWNPCPVASFGLDLLLLDTDAVESTVVVSSILGELYSDDAGGSFNLSTGGGQSQSVRYIGLTGTERSAIDLIEHNPNKSPTQLPALTTNPFRAPPGS